MLATEERGSHVRRIYKPPPAEDDLKRIRAAYDASELTLDQLADLIHQNDYPRRPDVSNLSKYLRGVLPIPKRMRRHIEEVLELRDRDSQ